MKRISRENAKLCTLVILVGNRSELHAFVCRMIPFFCKWATDSKYTEFQTNVHVGFDSPFAMSNRVGMPIGQILKLSHLPDFIVLQQREQHTTRTLQVFMRLPQKQEESRGQPSFSISAFSTDEVPLIQPRSLPHANACEE